MVAAPRESSAGNQTAADDRRQRVAVAGGKGFIGSLLLPALADDYEVVALTRSMTRACTPDPSPWITWRYCDLFSARDLEAGLAGCDYAIYLVHSLAPSSRLTQANPRDMDLVLADNFARAAAANGIKQIVFVGVTIPRGYAISQQLWSRREVELVLSSRGTPLTTLRAGLVVGPGGAAPGLLVELVRKLPVLPLPGSARSMTRPIALADLVRAIRHCIGRSDTYGTFDVGGPECMSYEQILRQTAQVLGRKRWIFFAPGLPIALATFVARVVSGAPVGLIGPIVASLPQDVIMHDNRVQAAIQPEAIPFRRALAQALDTTRAQLREIPARSMSQHDQVLMRDASLVRSIQRIILPPGQDAGWVSGNYFRWLSDCCFPIVCTEFDADGNCTVCLRFPKLCLLSLKWDAEQSTSERQIYLIDGGLLAKRTHIGRPRFEFQAVLGNRYAMAAIHDFAPALPWYVYIATQAVAHLRVMRRYQRLLARLAR